MRNLISLFLFLSILSIGCTRKDTHSTSDKSQDSLSLYFSLANSDSLSAKKREKYNLKALNIAENEENDSLRISALFKVANRFYNIGKISQYKEITQKILKDATKSNDTVAIAKAMLYLGDYFKYSTETDSAIRYYNRADKYYRALKNAEDLANINLKKAEVHWNANNYYACENVSLEALKFLRRSTDKQKLFEALTMLGLVSNALNDYDGAIEYLNRALGVVEEFKLDYNDPRATTLNNLGNVYQNNNENNLAIKNFKDALSDNSLESRNPSLYAILLDNLAYSEFKINPYGSDILPLFTKSLKVKDSLGYLAGIVFTKSRLGEYYFKKGDLKKAIGLSEQALLLSNKSGNPTDKLLPLRQLSEYDSENSKIYSKQYIKINDSVQQAERKIKDKFARIQFETDEISMENDKLTTKNRNLLLFFVGTVMIGLLLFVIRMQRSKNRELILKQAQQKANEDIYELMLSQQNKIEEGRIKEKKRIAQELHDGVLSRLFGARLNLDSLNKADGDDVRDKRNNYLNELKNIEQDIREISHDLNREKFVLINNFVAILTNLLEEQAHNFETEVETNIDVDIPWDKIDNNLKINIYRIVQESLQNVNKYAKASNVKISLQLENAKLHLEISDNGQGFAVDKKSKGIGLSNMISRTQECDGHLEIKSKKGKGTTISIIFPTEKNQDHEQTAISGEPVVA